MPTRSQRLRRRRPWAAYPGSSYALLEGAFLGATDWQQLLDDTLCPPNQYRYFTIDWNRPVADFNNIRAQHPRAKILAYQNFAGMRVGPHGTVGGQERATSLITREDAAAASESWFLHSGSPATSANRISFGGFPDLSAANVGNSGWRTAASQHFANIKAAGYDGVMLDDVNMMKSHWSGDIEFATDNAYRDAAIAAIAVLKAAADANGLILNGNVGGDPWNSDHRAGFTGLLAGPKLRVWNRESYLSWSSGTDGAPWTGGAWADTQSMFAEAEAAGVASQLEGRILSPPDHFRSLHYALASFYMEWGGRTASAFAYQGGMPVSIYAQYREAMGMPLGPKQLVAGSAPNDGAWMRYWTGGVACVNARSTAGDVTFTLGGNYKDGASTVSSVILGPGWGLTLLNTTLA